MNVKLSEREVKMLEKAKELAAFDENLKDGKHCILAGVDEVGRGCLAGPVMAACVVLNLGYAGLGIDDSKKLSEKKREQLYEEIISNAAAVGIGRVEAQEIDEINILNATKIAMKAAISECLRKMSENDKEIDKILIDAVELGDIKKTNGENIELVSVVKGDAKSLSVAAASIVAKVTRDRIMRQMGQLYPDYAFESNKGYGTKAHYAGIEKAGICPLHRKTFLKNLKI